MSRVESGAKEGKESKEGNMQDDEITAKYSLDGLPVVRSATATSIQIELRYGKPTTCHRTVDTHLISGFVPDLIRKREIPCQPRFAAMCRGV